MQEVINNDFDIKNLLSKIKKLESENTNLKKQNSILGHFTHLSKHEIQEPINTIISYISLLEESKKKLDEIGVFSLEVIKKSSYKIKKQITSLLDLSLTNTKTREEIVNTQQAISYSINSLKNNIATKNSIINVSENRHMFRGNNYEIELLFYNLIKNALLFSNKKSSNVINIQSYEEGNKIIYSISDNGIGIRKKDFEKIFDIFYTINTDENNDSIGMGLPICKKIIESNGGEIWLESELNKGSIFYFSLPEK